MSNNSLSKNELIILTPSLLYMHAKGVCEAKADANVQSSAIVTNAQSIQISFLYNLFSIFKHFYLRIWLWFNCRFYYKLAWISWNIFATMLQKSYL